ncbi:MAG: porin family protein [Myxococcota bacterium]|nr:outer membrane beta-barrel protein [Deltaproteobacteria bacterium]MDQ3336068.1 porin family protein [Myxococcota bacterium]
MSKSFVYSLFAVTALATVAHAQEPAAPAPAAEAPKKIQLSAGLFYGLPQGDFKEESGMDVVGSSPGLVLSGGYQVIPKLSVLAQIRYFVMSSEIDGVDLSMWDVGLGARYAHPMSPVLSVYGEGFVNRASYSIDVGGGGSDSSGIGFAVGGGVLYSLKPNVSLGGGLSYSSTSLEPEMGDSVSSGWVSLNAFASYHL